MIPVPLCYFFQSKFLLIDVLVGVPLECGNLRVDVEKRGQCSTQGWQQRGAVTTPRSGKSRGRLPELGQHGCVERAVCLTGAVAFNRGRGQMPDNPLLRVPPPPLPSGVPHWTSPTRSPRPWSIGRNSNPGGIWQCPAQGQAMGFFFSRVLINVSLPVRNVAAIV